MNKLKGNKGMTFIEIILSLAILGVVVVAFLNMFTVGYTHVINAGHKSAAGFLAHQAAEQTIAGGTPDPGVIVTTTPGTTITIQLPNPLPTPMTQSGQVISFEAEKNGETSKVTTFIP